MNEEPQGSTPEPVMADVIVEPTVESTPEESALQRAADWVKKHWARVRLGHEAVMLDRVQRVQRIGEIDARNAMTGKMDDATGWPGSEEGEKMGVDIGDSVVHYHYYGKGGKSGATPAQSEAGHVESKKSPSKLARVAVIATLLAWGAAGGIAIPWALGAFNRGPPAAERPVDHDTITQIELE